MSAPLIVDVRLTDRSYQIEIGSGLLANAGEFLVGLQKTSHAVVITDDNIRERHAQVVLASIQEHLNADLISIVPGEESKSIAEAEKIWNEMLSLGADRQSAVVAVGGGVVGDLAGFVSATYARGISFLQIPTTLLAQVDSSVGGKVGVNLPAAKNMVGAFWQPLGVLIDTDTLRTLPDRDYRAGLAEVVKYGVIMDPPFFAYLEHHVDEINGRDDSTLQYIVARCCQLKADVVAEDERETAGRRAILNYGHTFCHAFEAVAGYGELLHGEAVSIGMLCASRLAESLGRISADVTERQTDLLMALHLPTKVPAADHDQLLNAMQRDKKAEHGKLRFVLPDRLGNVELVGDIGESLVRKALF